MPAPLDSDLLRTFLAVAETGNVTRAAEGVGRTQSAVSMQIRRLEDRLELVGRRRGHRDGVREPGEQRRRRLVDAHVRGLRGQHRGDQQLERVAEVELAARVRVALRERPVDAPGPAGACEQGLVDRRSGLGHGGRLRGGPDE